MASGQSFTPTTIKEAIARFEVDEKNRRIAEATFMINARHDLDEASKQAQIEELKHSIPDIKAANEKVVKLLGMLPPIVKMDREIGTLTNCEHLALSTNLIEKIGPNLKELKNLKRLSLGRNAIKRLEQLDLPQLEELWISYNKIDKLSGLDRLKNLRVLYISNNQISSWNEIEKLGNVCPELQRLLLIGNPICPPMGTAANAPEMFEYRVMVRSKIRKLVELDGVFVTVEEREEAERRAA